MTPDRPPDPGTATWAQHALGARAIRQVLDAVEPLGIPVLPVKGILLARSLYSDVAQRPISDVDLRVRPRDLPRLERLALERGWRISHGSKQWGTFEVSLARMLVEFESSVGPPGLCAIPVEEMLERATRSSALGFPHLEPELHDHALFLCVNVFKDKIREAVPWALGDLVRIARQPGFDTARLAALTARAEFRTAVWLVADWAATTGGSEPWREVRDRLGSVPPRALYARAYRGLVASSGQGANEVLRVLARAGSDRASHRVLALALGLAGTMRASWYAHKASGERVY